MAVFKYDDAVKYKFKYLYEVINNIESNKKISVEVKKNQYQEELLVPTKKLKTLKTKLKTGSGPQIIQFLKGNINVFKSDKGQNTPWTKINKAPYSKSGGSRGGAEVTALAESMQCYFNSYYWGKGITASEPTEKQLKEQEKYCFTDRTLTQCLAADEIKSWRNDNVFDKIAVELKGRFNTIFKERPSFHRGSDFMNNIYKAKATVHKNDKEAARDNSPPTLPQAPGSFSNDKWNPGDIWMTTLSSGSKPLEDHVCTWGSLNDEVVHLANTGKMMGVSLKRVNAPRARTTFFNKKRKKEQQKYTGFSFGKRGDFFNSIDCYTYGSHSKTQFRAMQTDKSWQGELSSESAAGGKIGGGNVDFYLRDVFGKGLWTTGEAEARHKANVVDDVFIEEFWKYYQRFVLGNTDRQEVINPNNPTTKEEFTTKFNESSISFKFSKYLCLKMLEVMYDGTPQERRKLINLFYYYAASNTDQSSYFIKISDEGII